MSKEELHAGEHGIADDRRDPARQWSDLSYRRYSPARGPFSEIFHGFAGVLALGIFSVGVAAYGFLSFPELRGLLPFTKESAISAPAPANGFVPDASVNPADSQVIAVPVTEAPSESLDLDRVSDGAEAMSPAADNAPPVPAPAAAAPVPPRAADGAPSAGIRPPAKSAGKNTGAVAGAVPPVQPSRAPLKTRSDATGWGIQIGAFSRKEAADALLKKAAASGFQARTVLGTGNLWRVRVPAEDQASAEKAKIRLEESGFDTLVCRPLPAID